jgi:hypothetical protein
MCLLYGEWRRNLQTKIRIFYAQTYYRSMLCRRKLFLIGGKGWKLNEGGSFDRILMVRKLRFSMSKFTICLQFSSTKWRRQFSYPEPFLRAVRRGALAKSITGYHKSMVRKHCPVLELAIQMPVRNMDLARAPRRTARKKGSRYENVRRRCSELGSLRSFTKSRRTLTFWWWVTWLTSMRD